MDYQISASSVAQDDAILHIGSAVIPFGTTTRTAALLPNPAELLLASLAACILKNVERFSTILRYTYAKADIHITAVRLEHPPRMDSLHYTLTIYTTDPKLNVDLLQRNLIKQGTIYNTIALSCTVTGTINTSTDV